MNKIVTKEQARAVKTAEPTITDDRLRQVALQILSGAIQFGDVEFAHDGLDKAVAVLRALLEENQ